MKRRTISESYPSNMPIGARLFMKLVERLQHGHLQVITPDGNQLMFGNLHQSPSATLKINDWRACMRIVRAGDIGFAEAIEADWVSSPDLAALLRLAIRNQTMLQQVIYGGWISTLWYRIRHALRPNTRSGSRKNIHAHYDIGNDFYRLWLDSTMTYSSAVFDGDLSQSLQSAQSRKYQRIIDVMDLTAGDHVLEIGCGWGGFAEHAARQGIRVTGVTISPSQLSIAQQRIADQNLSHLAQLNLCDYRDMTGTFDAVVSIEMFEAVGERYWQEYFNTVSARLKKGGRAVIQSITIAESDFEQYRNGTDFIQQYIFPGGMLPSKERFGQHAEVARLQVDQEYCFGRDYAETLRRWHKDWEHHTEQIHAQGFDERFMRIWRLYFAYCEAGFDEGKTDVVQFLLHKP